MKQLDVLLLKRIFQFPPLSNSSDAYSALLKMLQEKRLVFDYKTTNVDYNGAYFTDKKIVVIMVAIILNLSDYDDISSIQNMILSNNNYTKHSLTVLSYVVTHELIHYVCRKHIKSSLSIVYSYIWKFYYNLIKLLFKPNVQKSYIEKITQQYIKLLIESTKDFQNTNQVFSFFTDTLYKNRVNLSSDGLEFLNSKDYKDLVSYIVRKAFIVSFDTDVTVGQQELYSWDEVVARLAQLKWFSSKTTKLLKLVNL
ncbi:MAG: hypothetical protein QXP36_11990 [Conexivisphaerales archaeon]